MHTYFIVIKKKNLLVTDKSVVEYFKSKGTSLITYELAKNNPHYHIILNTEAKIDAIRVSITRLFDLPRGYKSVKHVDNLEKSILYILKEQCVKHCDMLTEDELFAYQICSDKITVDRKSNTNPSKLFLEEFDVNEFELLEDDDEKHLYIQLHISKFFERPIINIEYRNYEKYYNRAICVFWKSEYDRLMRQFAQRLMNQNAKARAEAERIANDIGFVSPSEN